MFKGAALTQNVSKVFNPNDTRPGKQTNISVASLSTFPSFIHKWSRERRTYFKSELFLPNTVYIRGFVPTWDMPVVAVGGTRSPAVESFCAATNVVRHLARLGSITISGGVPGIDLASHLGALDAGGQTYAVLANPVDRGFCGHEWSNSPLEREMTKRGGFISEYVLFVDVFGSEFLERLLQRDRLISGLCDVFLVFECRENSATVDTAKRAMLQGKLVFCIDSGRRTVRVGIHQLAEEHGCPLLSIESMTVGEITEVIADALGKRGVKVPT